MIEKLERGKELLRQKQYNEAEIYFQEATLDPSLRKDALAALVQIAQAQKDFTLKVKRLDQLLLTSPDLMEAEITRAHLLAMKGPLADYRAVISEMMMVLKERLLPSVQTGKKLLRGIQYAYTGSQRIHYLINLLEFTKKAIDKDANPNLNFRLFEAEIYFALRDYSKLADTVEQFHSQKPVPSVLRDLRKVVKKYKSQNFPDYSAPKVFCIGLSRTATSSLYQALKILGFHTIHWLNPHTQKVISDEDFLVFDGFADILVSYQFEKLYYTFPNAKFIYTTRTIESWVHSITTHYLNVRQISTPMQLSLPDIKRRFDGAMADAEWNLYAQHPNWEIAFQCFQQRVDQFFVNKPKDRFLEMQICNGEGWGNLCVFLGKPIPDVPFPITNQGPVHLNSKTDAEWCSTDI